MGEVQRLLEELKKDIEPNPSTLIKSGPFCDLLGLVCEEYVLCDCVQDLTREERYEIAHWASCQHVAASYDDPPLPAIPEPTSLAKVVLKPGRKVLIEKDGRGVVTGYDWLPNSTVLDYKRAVVVLDSGAIKYVKLEEVIGVE
jgi:hypothetical protein